MKVLGLILLSVLIAFVCVVIAGYVLLPPMTRQERLAVDNRTCKERAGIRYDTLEVFQDTKRRGALVYTKCMLDLGYRGADTEP